MKTAFTLALALAALLPARAQIFRPEAASGAVLGAAAGAIIGHNSGSLNHNGWQGAAIGAGTGLILGSIADNVRGQRACATQVPVPAAPVYVYSPASVGYAYAPVARPNYAVAGTLLGGIAGAIIGHNSGGGWHHNGWRGAAIGSGIGWLLGSIAEDNARYREAAQAEVYSAPAQTVPAPAATPAPAPQQVTIINNYYNRPSPMAAANSLFGR